MKLVVVGASGNMGTALLDQLGDEQVIGVSRRRPSDRAPYDKARWHELDISQPGAQRPLEQLMRGADAVVHLAWAIQPGRDEVTTHRINVEGSRRVFQAAAAAGVPHMVYVSSVGAYSRADKRRPVGEDWPTGGVASSAYSRDKSAVERLLDHLERQQPSMTVTRLRPCLVVQRRAASEIQRYFIGPLVPPTLFRVVSQAKLPVLPLPRRLVLQFMHTSDLADALVRALHSRYAWPLNLAADPVITPARLADVVGARLVPIPERLLRPAASAGWRLRLIPASPGWVDLALAAPVLSSERARRELGWTPRYDAEQALRDLLDGLAEGDGWDSPVLAPRSAKPPAAGVPGR